MSDINCCTVAGAGCLLASFVTIVGFVGCTSAILGGRTTDPEPTEATAPSKVVPVGGTVRLDNGMPTVAVYPTADSADFVPGPNPPQPWKVPAGTRARVTAYEGPKAGLARIRIIGGKLDGRTGWVPAMWTKP